MPLPTNTNQTVVATITTSEDVSPLDMSARPLVAVNRLARWLHAFAGGGKLGTVDIQQDTTQSATGSSATLTLASSAAGEQIAINGVRFIAVSGTPLAANNEFKVGVTDTADAASLAAAINASSLSTVLKATSALGVLTLKAQGVGLGQNGITVETLGAVAKATLTPVTVANGDTFTINGTAFTAEQEMARQTFTVSTGVAGDTAVLGGVTFTCVASGATGNQYNVGASDTLTATALKNAINASTSSMTTGGGAVNAIVTASSSAGVVTVRAIKSGTGPNAITTTATGGVAAGGATMSGGAATSNNKFDYGDTTAQTIAEVLRAVSASTTALVNRQVFCTSTATLVNVYALFPGPEGNAVTLAGTGGFTASGARLTGGSFAHNWGASATGTITIASGSGNYTCTINGVNASGTVAYTSTDTATAAALAAAIALSTNALVQPLIYASSSGGVVTITATNPGPGGNAITLAATGTGTTVSGARLTGGADPTHALMGGTGVTQSPSLAGARLAGGAGLAGNGGANAAGLTF